MTCCNVVFTWGYRVYSDTYARCYCVVYAYKATLGTVSTSDAAYTSYCDSTQTDPGSTVLGFSHNNDCTFIENSNILVSSFYW